MNKKSKCSLCGWRGKRTHLHHITPLSKYGEDVKENIIEICPNCHAEACEDEKKFAKKWNLKGVKYSKDKLKDLSEGSFLFCKLNELNHSKLKRLYEITEKHGFDKADYIAKSMGISRRRVLELLVKDFKTGDDLKVFPSKIKILMEKD